MKEVFIEKLYECNRHAKIIKKAQKYVQNSFLLDVATFEELDDITLSFVDQMVYRFSKLQDTMGDKIFPSVLILLGENVKNKSFIDRLNRLEELELIEKETWMQLRKIRNEISHEYSFNFQEVVDNLNDIYDACDTLLTICNDFLVFSKDKFDFVKHSKQV